MDATPIRTVSNNSGDSYSPEPTLGNESNDTVPNGKDDVSPPLSAYFDLNDVPYSAKYFNVENYMNDPDFIDVIEMIAYLDEFAIEKVTDLKLQDTLESYDEIMQEVGKKIGQYENEDPVNRVRRFYTAVNAIARMESAKIEPVLDAINLNPDEYQILHGGKEL